MLSACLWLAMGLDVHAATPAPDAGDPVSEAEMCKHTLCQRNLRVTLRQRDGSTFDRTYEVFPGTVQPFGLAIVAGQTLLIEADVAGDKLTHFRVVAAMAHPDRTLRISLEQSGDGGMLLKLDNPFSRTLKFDMGMMPLEQPRLLKTSSCPILPGTTSFESWPRPLFQVVLANARLIDVKDGHSVCE